MNSKQTVITDELEALKYTFVELLRMKERLIINNKNVSNFKRANRSNQRVKKSLEKQTQTIAADLNIAGVSRMEIAALMIEAKNIE